MNIAAGLVSLAFLQDEAHNSLGIVIVFDDLTALIKAQKVAAWREVPKQLAHQIKNPLTPIQLSAQCLQQKAFEGTAFKCSLRNAPRLLFSRLLGVSALLPEIPDQFREKIFDPYFSTKQRGTGLGLSLVRRILTDHCGSLKVVKRQYAAGATFLIELPIT